MRRPRCWASSAGPSCGPSRSSRSRRCLRHLALAEVETEIDELAEKALAALDGADITDDARKALEELAHYVAWREQ